MNYNKFGLVLFSLISTATIASEERTELKFDAMPEAVRYTVSHFIDRNNITKIEKVADNGFVKFEIKSTKTVDNKKFVVTDMTVAADGDIMFMAKEAPFFDIPFPVMKQLNLRYPDLKVDEVEIVQKRYFLLTGKTNEQPVNLKVYDDGEIQEIPFGQDNKVQGQSQQPLDQSIDAPTSPPQESSQ